MFEDPPGCLLHHQAIVHHRLLRQRGRCPEDFDFFPFPDINRRTVERSPAAGDLVGMFNDTPQARSLITRCSPRAQQIWVERGGFISGNNGVPLEAYPDETSRNSAEILQNAETSGSTARTSSPVR